MQPTPIELMNHLSGTSSPRWRRWLHEPVLHFLFIGGLLVLVSRVFPPAGADQEIVVDAQRIERLSQLYSLQTGALPTSAERKYLIDDFVRDETLYREARRLQLDEGDELVRRRLVQKMEFLIASDMELETPSEEALRGFYREHAAQFTAPMRVSFLHVFFSPDSRGRAGARETALATLNAHGAANAEIPAGDRPPLPARFEQVTREDLQRIFGSRPIVQALVETPTGKWTGPVESGLGWHLVRVIERSPAAALSFEQVRGDVEAAWMRQARAQGEQKRMEALRQQYRLVLTE